MLAALMEAALLFLVLLELLICHGVIDRLFCANESHFLICKMRRLGYSLRSFNSDIVLLVTITLAAPFENPSVYCQIMNSSLRYLNILPIVESISFLKRIESKFHQVCT